MTSLKEAALFQNFRVRGYFNTYNCCKMLSLLTNSLKIYNNFILLKYMSLFFFG